MRATLFGLASSHPTLTAELMLRHKRIPYRRIDLMPGVHRGVLKAMGYPGITVPAMKLDGTRLQRTRTISRALDSLVPSPPLFPAEPEQRRAVEEAEAWGDGVLQPIPRRIVWNALKHDRSELATYLEGAKTGIPLGVAARLAPPIAVVARVANRATDENVRRDLEALPRLFDRVDELIEQGVIGGAEPNAADFQIATSVSLLLTMDDIRPMIDGRPAERLASALVPHQPGHTPSVYAT
jgi:glutathione S-transferase